MSMPMVPLGLTDMKITRIGFGAWAAGGADWWYSWGDQDDDVSVATIHRALEGGVNWIDTAAIYGLGHSEEVVGRAVRDLPESDRPLIFTKCGFVWDTARPNDPPPVVGERSSVRRECEDSLRRLGVERIDLYQMHAPPTDVPVEDYWATMLELRQEGKVRAVGLSNHSVSQLEVAEQVGHVESVQPPFSAIKRGAGGDVIPWAHEHSTGVITYSPMQAGLLTGAFTLERAASLPPGDWRSRDPEFLGEAVARNLALSHALQPVADRHGVSRGALAIAWVCAWPGVTGAIVGARTPAQVDGWLPTAGLDLSQSDLDEIATAILATGAGEGPPAP
jgi:aryl-alcohol dehydrogenase-like predicted oxidoreductase